MTYYISDLRENSVIHPLNQAHISLDGVLQINKLSSEDKDVGCALAKLTEGIASLLSEDNRWVNVQIIEVSSGVFL
ncbi:hypothetical protein IQ241_23900 [Romeria aff. gracilis LEGE 07310]|uniref:Uncharacterized protein n=1 Tax=Vasconcelosia minhoensis LEGE 07310 TaxID=915328 RepID=A0A8J7AK04_9CYAN|nr:hypothetical protein [Romeria gracilis]MBE9080294.1 hypothetical protein [Romeria aff. gracilis LEGE 07310]